VGELKKAEIIEASGSTPGSPGFLRNYKKAVGEVMKTMSDEAKGEAMDLARKWNKSGPPREVQIRYIISINISTICNQFCF